MIRLFVADDLRPGAPVTPSEAQAHYLRAVMRLAVGDCLLVFNGRDGEWRARLTAMSRRGCALTAEAEVRAQATGPDLDLIIALVKRPRLETIVEKATELGVREIRPVVTQHAIADRANISRLRAIAIEAAEQTGRLDVPRIASPAGLEHLLEGLPGGRKLMFCDEAGDAPPALEALRAAGGGAWSVLIGPEGGFSAAERVRIRAHSAATPVSLGPRILRADTAAICAIGLWQAALGDWRGLRLAARAPTSPRGAGP